MTLSENDLSAYSREALIELASKTIDSVSDLKTIERTDPAFITLMEDLELIKRRIFDIDNRNAMAQGVQDLIEGGMDASRALAFSNID